MVPVFNSPEAKGRSVRIFESGHHSLLRSHQAWYGGHDDKARNRVVSRPPAERDAARPNSRVPPQLRHAYRATRLITTRWMDNDIYGHMNNVIHYSLFDTAVNGWLIERGLLKPGASEQIGLVVETGCRYHAEMAFPDLVTAGIRVARVGRTSVRYEVGLFRNQEEAASAEGFFVHVYVDRTTRRPVPLNEALRAALMEISL